ncbi:MAG: toll/interleukin-1 receptor domain-containing protein [Desulfobacterales bacterium]|nr:toll/interleukin-1 receptor domain-containing protein [Desulfobacterales bacterium]
MSSKFSVFLSHIAEDEYIAVALKRLIENVFLNSQVFVAGRDLSGGEVWVKEIRDQLRVARVILAVITPYSKTTPWLLFEAGAGFIDSRTIPVCADGVSIDSLDSPLKLLQARVVDQDGLKRLMVDIAKHAELRVPEHFPGLEDALNAIEEFCKERGQSQVVHSLSIDQPAQHNVGASYSTAKTPDPELKAEFYRVAKLIRDATITSIERGRMIFELPSHDELRAMDQGELDEVASCFNIPRPSWANLVLRGLQLYIPSENDSKWKKMNARKAIEEAEKELNKFMKELFKIKQDTEPVA